jgi:hypothetical protein
MAEDLDRVAELLEVKERRALAVAQMTGRAAVHARQGARG